MPNALEAEVKQRWEAPDVIHAQYIGDLHAEHMRAAQEEAAVWLKGAPYFFTLIDVSQLGSVSADARRAMATNGEAAKTSRGIAIVGASFHFRALGTMVARAIAILHSHVDNPIRFFSTEDEARVWLAERRSLIASGK